VPYVFGLNGVLGNIDGERAAVSQLMQSYWVNNVVAGNPAGDGLPVWPQYDANDRNYMELDTTPQVAADLKAQKCALLNSLPLISI